MGYIIPFLFLFLILPGEVEAANLNIVEENDPYNTRIKDWYHNWIEGHDGYTIDFRDSTVYKVYIASYNSDFSQKGTERTTESTSGNYAIRYTLTCNTAYVMELYNKTGMLIYDAKVIITGLENPQCYSGGDQSEIEEGCDICDIFNCPGWNQYLNKLDDIKNAIPPPPNWQEVSQVFSDAIVPRLVDETRVMLDDLLGRAPEPPTPPAEIPTMPDLPVLDDGGFKDNQPDLQDSGLKGFDENEIKDNAPELNYEEDETGGFDLSVDPVDSLPDVLPGGDPGAYKRDPEMMDAEFPGAPKEQSGDIGKPSNPKDDLDSPPKPGGDIGNPPTPGGDTGAPPTPGDGGSIGNPPIPGDSGEKPPGYMSKPK